ncbi:hypothetical protein CMI47_03455 [Candidatus Pacearchaeota archaeon]|nr:hypothetical protein [Candidatus Pacearchaeota archaeon]|tara:strand:- start:162 stop:650 length:489 start_codon:yes stop_codon:yes gene_type:complete
MPAQNILRYVPPVDSIKSEDDIVTLLEDVQKTIDDINSGLRLDLMNTFVFLRDMGIDRVYDLGVEDERGVRQMIDLSSAVSGAKFYDSRSQPGCSGCEHQKMHKPETDETVFYCGVHEPNTIRDGGFVGLSPTIQKYRESGCEDRKAIFRPIDEVLSEVEVA